MISCSCSLGTAAVAKPLLLVSRRSAWPRGTETFGVSCSFGNGIFPQGSTFRACVVMPSSGSRCFLRYGVCCVRGERGAARLRPPCDLPASHRALEKPPRGFPSLPCSPSFPAPLHFSWGWVQAVSAHRATPAALNPSQSALGSLWSCRGTSSSPGFVLSIAALPGVSRGHENHPQANAQTPLSWESAPALPLQPLGLRVMKGRSSSRLISCFPL